ncbi:hypothetical protein NR800_29055 [Corallococcus interemptor]|uniref:hypothetical protein n=1 Tax=Corallococcus interemptor TaxID=2316720 RepID=UPI0035D4C30F
MGKKKVNKVRGRASDQPAKASRNPDTDPWDLHYFKRHKDDDLQQSLPAREFLLSCPKGVRGKFVSCVNFIARTPPPKLPRNKYFDPMTGDLTGVHEVRIDGPDRRHYRLFVKLERAGLLDGLKRPSVVLLWGLDKPFKTTAREEDYQQLLKLYQEYEKRSPRNVLGANLEDLLRTG